VCWVSCQSSEHDEMITSQVELREPPGEPPLEWNDVREAFRQAFLELGGAQLCFAGKLNLKGFLPDLSVTPPNPTSRKRPRRNHASTAFRAAAQHRENQSWTLPLPLVDTTLDRLAALGTACHLPAADSKRGASSQPSSSAEHSTQRPRKRGRRTRSNSHSGSVGDCGSGEKASTECSAATVVPRSAFHLGPVMQTQLQHGGNVAVNKILGVGGDRSGVRVEPLGLIVFHKCQHDVRLFNDTPSTDLVPRPSPAELGGAEFLGFIDFVLPSRHTGGNILLQNADSRKVVTLDKGVGCFQFFAFHRLARLTMQPITSGARVVLRTALILRSKAFVRRPAPTTHVRCRAFGAQCVAVGLLLCSPDVVGVGLVDACVAASS